VNIEYDVTAGAPVGYVQDAEIVAVPIASANKFVGVPIVVKLDISEVDALVPAFVALKLYAVLPAAPVKVNGFVGFPTVSAGPMVWEIERVPEAGVPYVAVIFPPLCRRLVRVGDGTGFTDTPVDVAVAFPLDALTYKVYDVPVTVNVWGDDPVAHKVPVWSITSNVMPVVDPPYVQLTVTDCPFAVTAPMVGVNTGVIDVDVADRATMDPDTLETMNEYAVPGLAPVNCLV
jgi:hypothetical protein